VPVKIPFMPTSESAQPLHDCIRVTAQSMAVSEYFVALTMSYFLEELAVQVCRDRMVSIPGFGAFGAKVYEPTDGRLPRPYPAFVASRAFRNMVLYRANPVAPVAEQLEGYRRRHNVFSRPDKTRSMTHIAMHAWRVHIEAQAREISIDPYDKD